MIAKCQVNQSLLIGEATEVVKLFALKLVLYAFTKVDALPSHVILFLYVVKVRTAVIATLSIHIHVLPAFIWQVMIF